MQRTIQAALLAVACAWEPGTARAYVADSFDARVAPYGALELELEPVGYYLYRADSSDEHYLVLPSIILYAGLVPRFNLVVSSKGYLGLQDTAPRYQTREGGVFVRWLLRDGAYGDATGPAFVLMAGALLPNLEQRDTVGASLGALMSWTTDGGTIHANVIGNRTTWKSWDVFLTAAYEGPIDWTVRPYVEGWFDYDQDGGATLSGLVGAYVDASDTVTLGAGVRYAAGEGFQEVEIRTALWWQIELWEAETAASE